MALLEFTLVAPCRRMIRNPYLSVNRFYMMPRKDAAVNQAPDQET